VTDFSFRQVQPDDVNFFIKAFHEVEPTFYSFQDGYAWDTFAKFICNPNDNSFTLVAEEDGSIAGFYISVTHAKNFWQSYLNMLGAKYLLSWTIKSKFSKKRITPENVDESEIDPEYKELFDHWVDDIPGHAKGVYVYMRSESRGKGLAGAIVLEIESRLKNMGYASLEGTIKFGNEQSYRMLSRSGYSIRNVGICNYVFKKL